jgi:ABC-type multidrug transport system ATPase subunit
VKEHELLANILYRVISVRMRMNDTTLRLKSLSKSYLAAVFSNITVTLKKGSSLAVTGKNGSGKSTLLKTACGLLTPTHGSIKAEINGTVLAGEELFQNSGILLPDLMPHGELTLKENIAFLSDGRSAALIEHLANLFSLNEIMNKRIGSYSSGQLQRAKILLALFREPAFLFLDEPSSYLDDDGVRILHEYLEKIKSRTLIMIATNDAREISLCVQRISLDE